MSLIIARTKNTPFVQIVWEDHGRLSFSMSDIGDLISRYVHAKEVPYGKFMPFDTQGMRYIEDVSFDDLTPKGIQGMKGYVRSSVLRLDGECCCEIFGQKSNRDFVVTSAFTRGSNLVVVDT